MNRGVRRIDPVFDEKIWGSTRLAPWFPDSDRGIGEVVFDAQSESFPLITKFIFTTENLSVQVHPDDARAREAGLKRGKTEAWYILRAEPEAKIAVGLSEAMSKGELRAASESGAIERKLNWIPARRGQSIFIPAGTIHALGAGITIVEVQQNSQTTYRLYDYGRPRDLHLDEAIKVSIINRHISSPPPSGFVASCDYFAVEELLINEPFAYTFNREHELTILEGEATINGERTKPGDLWHIETGAAPLRLGDWPLATGHWPLRALRTYVPATDN